MFKKLCRALRNRREVVLELNNTQTLAMMMNNGMEEASTMEGRAETFRYFDQSAEKRGRPVVGHVYMNEPREEEQETISTSQACSQFSDKSSTLGSDLKIDGMLPSSCPKAKLNHGQRATSEASFVNDDVSSLHSFAMENEDITSNESSDQTEESSDDMEKMTTQFFGAALEPIEASVQSSLEAFNEYIRIKHTISIIKSMPMKNNASSELMNVYLNGLVKSLQNTMAKLDKEYPHLHSYGRPRGLKRFQVKKTKE